MKRPKPDLTEEVSELLLQSTLVEAHEEVNRRFEIAFQSLDKKTQAFLSEYFNGATLEELSQEHSLTPQETAHWINQAKRDLLRSLQRGTSVRQ